MVIIAMKNQNFKAYVWKLEPMNQNFIQFEVTQKVDFIFLTRQLIFVLEK